MSHSNPQASVAPAITEVGNLSQLFFVLPPLLLPWKPTIMSYTLSLVTTFSGYPLDSLKTRMQAHKFNGTFHCLQQTLKYEGVRGLYRGMTSPLITASFSKSLGVSLYTLVKPQVAKGQQFVYTPVTGTGIFKDDDLRLAVNNIPVAIVSGNIAGAFVSLFACPFEFTKIFSQLSMIVRNKEKVQTLVPRNLYQVCREIIKYEGFKGLYSGYRFHFIRDAVSNGLFFATYETFKISMRSLTENGKFRGTDIPATQVSIVLAGGAAGMFSWFTVFPIDTLKSMTQRDIVSNILRRRDGLEPLPVIRRSLGLPTKRMYRGLGPSLTRSVVTTMIFFSVYEYLMARIG